MRRPSRTPRPVASCRTACTSCVAGDTLAGIAYAEYGNPNLWRAVAELNHIDDPMRLRPGQRLMLPTVETLGARAEPRDESRKEAAHAAR